MGFNKYIPRLSFEDIPVGKECLSSYVHDDVVLITQLIHFCAFDQLRNDLLSKEHKCRDRIERLKDKNLDFKKNLSWGTWMAQSLKYMTLAFGSDHDLRVLELSPEADSMLSKGSAVPLLLPLFPHLFSLSLSFSLFHSLSHTNRIFKKNTKICHALNKVISALYFISSNHNSVVLLLISSLTSE